MKWIKYPENQPEKNGSYLVADGDSMTVAEWTHGIWQFHEDETLWSNSQVTHFTPLPESPNEYNTEG